MGSRRPHIRTGRGSLEIGGIPAKALAEAYGTPLYVTDLDRVSQRYEEAAAALSSRHKDSLIAFAYKSNSTGAVVKELAKRGAGATVVSVAGLELARRSGVGPKDIVLDGPSKSKEELEAAVRGRIGMINVESTEEALDVEAIAKRRGVRGARVGFRVNFGIRADTHAGLATGSREHKFGVAKEEVVRFCEEQAPKLRRAEVVGLHSHVGSQIADPSVFRRLAREMTKLGDELRRSGVCIEEYNFGGGVGVWYSGEDRGMSFEDYADATAGTFRGRRGSGDPRLVFELGRSIVADSTVLLTRVNYLKAAGGTNWALVDAGMNDFIRPMLYGARHEIVAAHAADPRESNVAYDIGGPVCESTDVLGADRRLGVRLSRGDVLAVMDTGAYGISMASHYNMRPLPGVAVVTKGRHRLARRAEPNQ